MRRDPGGKVGGRMEEYDSKCMRDVGRQLVVHLQHREF